MPLELHPMSPTDMLQFTTIQYSVFNSGIIKLISPSPLTPAAIKEASEKHIKCLETEPDCHYLKVIDTELPEGEQLIAGAKWRINEKERGEEEIKKMLPDYESEEAGSAKRDFLQYLSEGRRVHMGGRPFACKS